MDPAWILLPGSPFELAHGSFFGRVGVIPAADVQRPVRDEQTQFVGG